MSVVPELHPQLVTAADGQEAIPLPAKEFAALLEVLEDYLDGLALDRAIEQSEGMIDFEDAVARLRAIGKL